MYFAKPNKAEGKTRAMADYVNKTLLEKISLFSKPPFIQNQAKENSAERRQGIEDRRRLHTYIAKDRRSGIADRRKHQKKANRN